MELRKTSAPALSAARRTALLGLLSAMALVLSVLEGILPVLPVPGAKMGLSNIVTMYALSTLGLPSALVITLIKGGFAFIRGGIACVMSLTGGLASTLLMAFFLQFKTRFFSFIGIGVIGACAHNGGQLLAAMLLLDPALRYYTPWLLLMALLAGLLTGITLNVLMPVLGRIHPVFASKSL